MLAALCIMMPLSAVTCKCCHERELERSEHSSERADACMLVGVGAHLGLRQPKHCSYVHVYVSDVMVEVSNDWAIQPGPGRFLIDYDGNTTCLFYFV